MNCLDENTNITGFNVPYAIVYDMLAQPDYIGYKFGSCNFKETAHYMITISNSLF